MGDFAYKSGYCGKGGLCTYSEITHCEIGCSEEDVFEGIVPLVTCECLEEGLPTEQAGWCCSGLMENNTCIAEKEVGFNIVPKSIYLKGIINKIKKKTLSVVNTGEIEFSVAIEVESQFQMYVKPIVPKKAPVGELTEIELEFNILDMTKSFNLDVLLMTDSKKVTKTLPVTLEGVLCYELGYDDCDFDSDCCSGYCSDKRVCHRFGASSGCSLSSSYRSLARYSTCSFRRVAMSLAGR